MPSSKPSSHQRSVEIESFSIAYASQNDTLPSESEVAALNIGIVVYFTELFTSLFDSSESIVFEGLSFEIDSSQYGNSSIPGFNINVPYRFAHVEFSKKQAGQEKIPTSRDLFQEMQNGITVDFLLNVVRTRQDTAFADVNTVRMLLKPQTEWLGRRFFIAYNSENATMPDEGTLLELARFNQAYFNDYFFSVYLGDHSTDFVGVDLALESTEHGTDPDLPVDGFNILLRYSSAAFFFGANSPIPSEIELFDFLQQGITFDYLLEVRRLFVGTAFGDTIEVLVELDV